MRNYLLFDEGLEKLKASGLKEKIDKKIAKNRDDFSFFDGHFYDDEIVKEFKRLGEKGYYKNIPDELKERFKTTLESILRREDKYFWKTIRDSKEVNIDSNSSDILLLGGVYTSEFMTPLQMWNSKKYKFDNPIDLIATVGVYVLNLLKKDTSYRDPYSWEIHKNGRKLVSSIYGSDHYDFRAERRDITNYETFSPIGEKVNIRPRSREDLEMIAAYHSVESQFLKIILRRRDQCDIKSELFENDGKILAEFIESLDGIKANIFAGCAQHLSPDSRRNSKLVFAGYKYPICDWNDEKRNFGYSIGTGNGGCFSGFIKNEDELIFSYSREGTKNEDMKENLTYYREDFDHIIKGLLIQAKMQHGRTSLGELIGVLGEYLKNGDKFLRGEYE